MKTKAAAEQSAAVDSVDSYVSALPVAAGRLFQFHS
jgi:hypothetical protein